MRSRAVALVQVQKAGRMAQLYDFYAPLLTDKQRQAVELYYHDDLSLGEVAGCLGISRQGVHDLLRRTEAALEDYEARLHLVERYRRQRRHLDDLVALVTRLVGQGGAREADRRRAAELVTALLADIAPPGETVGGAEGESGGEP